MDKTIEIELTDPSKELAALAELMTRVAGGQNTIDGLSKSIGISLDDPEFLDVLAAIQRRIREVESLATTADDLDFDQEMRSEVLSAVRGFMELVHPKNAHGSWDHIRQSSLSPKNITALKFFSQTARRYRPLRIVPSAAQQEARQKIADIIAQVRDDKELEDWMKTILITGLARVELMLKYLKFFGHEAAITELILTHQKLSVIRVALESKKSSSNSFQQAVVALSVIANLFVLPDAAITAFKHYKASAYNVLDVIVQTEHQLEQRLLPAPEAFPPPKDGKVEDV